MSKNDRKRQELFNLLSANLELYDPDNAGKFRCPICLDVFGADSIIGPQPKVDLAHVYSESCGGKIETLACADCNSHVGTWFENDLVKEHRLWSNIQSPDHGIVAKLEFPEGFAVNARFYSTGPAKTNIEVLAEKNNPKNVELFKAAISKPNLSTLNFTLNVPTYHQRKLDVALLHAAYMMMFRMFGYEYIWAAPIEPIRELLTGRAAPPHTDFLMMTDLPKANNLSKQLLYRVGIMTDPPEYKSFCVGLPSPNPQVSTRAIFLPGFGETDCKAYEKLWEDRAKKFTVRATVLKDDLWRHLGDPNYRYMAQRLWRFPGHDSAE